MHRFNPVTDDPPVYHYYMPLYPDLSELNAYSFDAHTALVLSREFSGVIPKDVAAQSREREDWRNDGVDVIGKAMWKILEA